MKKTGTKNKKRRPKGTGSIYYVASRKRYAGQTQVDLGGGKTKTKTVYGKTKTEVADKLKELERQSIRGEYIEKDKTVFYDFAEMLFNEQLELNEVRQSTYDRKMATLKMLSDITGYEIQEMTEDIIKRFFKKKLYYSQSSINKMYQLLTFVFKKAIGKKLIMESPMRDMKCPNSKQEKIPVRALTIEEQSKLLEVLKTKDILYGDVMLLSMFTGIRIGECCALMVEDIDLKRKTIHINKTMSRGELGDTKINPPKTKAGIRTLYVNNEIVSFLKEVIGDKKSGLLFRCTNGNLLTTNLVNYPYTKVMKEYHIIDQTVYGKARLICTASGTPTRQDVSSRECLQRYCKRFWDTPISRSR